MRPHHTDHDATTSQEEEPALLDDSRAFSEMLGQQSVTTATFFADSRASSLCLAATLPTIMAELGIQRVITDIASPAGVAIAAWCNSTGMPYDVLVLDGSDPTIDLPKDMFYDSSRPATMADAPFLISRSMGATILDPSAMGDFPGNVVVIPAMEGSDQAFIDVLAGDQLDMGLSTLPGNVAHQAERARRSIMLIDTPERGLVRSIQGEMLRRVLRIGTE